MNQGLAVRREQGRLLLRPSARTIRWASFVIIAALGTLIVWSGTHEGGDPSTLTLPVATTLLCVWLCFLFEDLAAETTSSSATPLLFRRAVRAAIAVPPVAAVWFAHTWIGPLTGPSATMVGSFAAEVMFTLAAAAVAVRLLGSGRSGLGAAVGVVFVFLIAPAAFGRPPSVDPAVPPFGSPLTYWSTVAFGSAAMLALAHLDRFQRS